MVRECERMWVRLDEAQKNATAAMATLNLADSNSSPPPSPASRRGSSSAGASFVGSNGAAGGGGGVDDDSELAAIEGNRASEGQGGGGGLCGCFKKANRVSDSGADAGGGGGRRTPDSGDETDDTPPNSDSKGKGRRRRRMSTAAEDEKMEIMGALQRPNPWMFTPTSVNGVRCSCRRLRSASVPPQLRLTPPASLSSCFMPQARWDATMGILIVWSIILVPLNIAFRNENPPLLPSGEVNGFYIWDLLCDCLFGLDMVKQFNTAYVADGFVHWDRTEVTSRYLKGWFIIDLVSTFPFQVIGSDAAASRLDPSAFRIMRLVRLMKLIRMLKMLKFVKEIQESGTVSPTFFRLASLALMTLYACHFFGCVWFSITTWSMLANSTCGYELDPPCFMPPNGTDDFRFLSDNLYIMTREDTYVSSFYWAAGTLTTLAYGGSGIIHTPRTDTERVVVIILQLMGACVFGYIIGTISSVLETASATEQALNDKTGELNGYMAAKNFPAHLQKKLRKYFTAYWTRSMMMKDCDMILDVSGPIRSVRLKQMWNAVPVLLNNV